MFSSQKQVSFETAHNLIFDKKFDTAIRASTAEQFFSRLEGDRLNANDRLLTESPHVKHLDEVVKIPTLYPKLISDVLRFSTAEKTYDHKHAKTYHRISEIVPQIITHQWDYINSQNELSTTPLLTRRRQRFFQERTLPSLIINLYYLSDAFQEVVSHMAAIDDPKYKKLSEATREKECLLNNHSTIDSIDMALTWSRNLVYIKYQTTRYLLPKPYVLMMQNKINDLISVLIYALYSSGVNLEKDAYMKTVDFVRQLADLGRIYKNKF
jgi:hypothetical protein